MTRETSDALEAGTLEGVGSSSISTEQAPRHSSADDRQALAADDQILAAVGVMLARIRTAPPVAPFGSHEWVRAAYRGDPAAVASALIAAAAWRSTVESHVADLDLAVCADPAARFLDDGGAIRAALDRQARRLDDARRPRPGDHEGGAVAVWGPTEAGSAA